MNISNLLSSLNDKQRNAVVAPNKHVLILAGAGSGKTRVLAHRIAWLLSTKNHQPHSVMAVTFTNKAAEEMRHRIEYLINSTQSGIWIGTFHSLAYRLLRFHYKDVNLPQNFQILDSEDQIRLLKRLIRTMNLNEKKWLPHKAMWYICKKKDAGLRPRNIENSSNSVDATWQRIYKIYQEFCDRAGLVDFTELLLRANELWLNNPCILHHYCKRFTNVLVDEFQDTNQIQYNWIRMLVGNDNNMTIVGDDDQSIYSWRGAQVKNIQRFLDDFPNAQIIRLEQNYRSTGNILKAANALISHNGSRLGKNLWTTRKKGDLITTYCAVNELDEACFVVDTIKTSTKKGFRPKDCAILYRSNAQSRVLEETLLQSSIPYRIYGGMRFFERQEIKDALAYLRLIINRNDDAAYERAVNMPPRGLGARTLDIVRRNASNRQLTLWQSSQEILARRMLTSRAAAALERFLKLIDTLEQKTAKLPLHLQTDHVIKNSGLWSMYAQGKGEKGQSRIENLKELVTAAHQFIYKDKYQNPLPLQSFLSYSVLESDENKINAYQDAVQLMTLHSAKGLEFPQVFIVGMEEGIFPNKVSLETESQLEEERRLAYVGVTRAMKKLTITYTDSRWLYGKKIQSQPSRFISELPSSCIKKVHFYVNAARANGKYCLNKSLIGNNYGFTLGQRVFHPKFGKGTVIRLEGSGEHSKLQIEFQNYGIKWLMIAYAQLKIV